MKNIPLSWQIVIAIIAAMPISYIFPSAAAFIGELTELYIRILSLILIPFVFFTMIEVFVSENTNGVFSRLSLKSLTWFVTVQTVAVVISLIISGVVFQNFTISIENSFLFEENDYQKNFGDFIFSAIPENIFKAIQDNNLLAILLITFVLGILASGCKDRTRTYFVSFFSSFSELMQKCANFAAALSPFGVFCLVCKISTQGGIIDNFNRLLPFIIAVLTSLLFYSTIILPLILKIMTKSQPFKALKTFSSIIFISAFSQNPTLAVPLGAIKMKNEAGISSKFCFFSFPLTSVLSFCATSIYLCVAAMYISKAYEINMTFSEQIILVLSAVFISAASFEVPLKLSVLLYPVLERIGIPVEGIGILVSCDILFSFICSGLDTWSNICANIVIASSEGDNLRLIDPPDNASALQSSEVL